LDTNIKGSVSEINRIADQIAALNQQIANIEIGGQNANDLRDERDLLLNELSSMIDTTTSEDSDGKVTVLVNGGRPLVQNDVSWHLSTETNSLGLQDIVWLDGAGNSVNLTDTISGGKMKGWLEVRDVVVPGYLNNFDDLANEIRLRVNNLHSSGFGLDGSTGNAFFIGTSASDISVNPNILADVDLIAAAGAAAGIPGDNSMAIAIAGLQNELTMSGNTTTFSDFYNSMVSDLGNAVQESSINYERQSAVVNHLNNYRESVSGVSIEEEMVNLIRFQHAYEAAAKLISTADELLETLISMV
jgi:flagellar hook-associated protein 1 FlgK